MNAEKEKIIADYMKKLDLTREEAEELYECDFGKGVDEEQEELDEKASKVKIKLGAGGGPKSDRKPRTCKISDEKTKFFSEICEFLDENEVNYQISKENKLIFIKIGEKFFKLDLIESRTPLF